MLDSVQAIGSGSIADRIWTKPSITTIGFDCTTHRRRQQHAHRLGQGEGLLPGRPRRRRGAGDGACSAPTSRSTCPGARS